MDIIVADYDLPEHQRIIGTLMNAYASDEMGGGEALSEEVVQTLAAKLKAFGKAITFLAVEGEHYLGLVNCIQAFSTFKAKPILNIHDVIVVESARGRGVAPAIMNAAEAHARATGCCKLTLEVLEGNASARRAYEKIGYTPYELDPEMGRAMFWHKIL